MREDRHEKQRKEEGAKALVPTNALRHTRINITDSEDDFKAIKKRTHEESLMLESKARVPSWAKSDFRGSAGPFIGTRHPLTHFVLC